MKNSHGNDHIIYDMNNNNEKEQWWAENTDNYADDDGLKDGNYSRTHHWFISEGGNKERGLHLTKWPNHDVKSKQENTNEGTRCSENFPPTHRTPSIFLHEQIITSHASSGILIAEDWLNVHAAACLHTCEKVQSGIYVHLCVIACFYPRSPKTTPKLLSDDV